jgi:outer membrane protein assembly complex protein YaeT
MMARWLIAVGIGGVLLVGGGSRTAFGNEAGSGDPDATSARLEAATPIIDEIVFAGLRHISPAAVQAQISSRAGAGLDLKRVESDVKALGRLGWFGEIVAEAQPTKDLLAPSDPAAHHVRLVFRIDELPYLAKVEYSGSRHFSPAQIEKIIGEKQLTPKLGEPADPANLACIANAIRSALGELGQPQPEVQIHRDESVNGTVRVRFQINDGPHIPVGRIEFEGHPEISEQLLRHEMRRTAPGALFAHWRGKDAFTREGFEEDRSRILIYYQDHGFPEARVGSAQTLVYEKPASRWIPRSWRRRASEKHLRVSVPIEAGPAYRLESVDVSPELAAASGKHAAKLTAYSKMQCGSAYSAKALEDLRHAWVAAVEPKRGHEEAPTDRSIETSRTFDPEAHLVRERINFTDAPPYIVRRIEFTGLHRFSDRYLRRRIGLQEGRAFDEHALETGLSRLAKTGYFHQIKREDIQVHLDDISHTANVTIRVSEAGQQRTLFSGGHGQFGNTLGIVYSLFDLLQQEELLTAQLDGGPESLQIVIGLVMEGFLGSHSSLAISVFDNVLLPRFASSVKGPFYASQSEGLNTGWSFAMTKTDSVAVNYGLSHTNTDYSFALPPSLPGLPTVDLRAKTFSSAVGLAWVHDIGSERLSIANSISGGWLGGTDNVIRSNEEFARIFPDPVINRHNTWAFRTAFSGVGSYQGDMPFYARLFSGDAQVRGLNADELGPYAAIPSVSGSGNQTYSALPAGANIVSAANAEYRVPLGGGTQAVGFFDLGAGWLLPNWLGQTRPTLLDSTNGILHGSVGIELRWTVPGIRVPVRAYYAVNVLRLNSLLQFPDGSLFHAHNRLFAFGWALGTLF